MRFLTIAFVFAFVAACSAQARLGIPEQRFIPIDRSENTARLGIPEQRFIPIDRSENTARLGIPEERFIPIDRSENTARLEIPDQRLIPIDRSENTARLGIPEEKFIPLQDENVDEEQGPANDIHIHRGEGVEGIRVPVIEPVPRSGNNVRIPHLWNRFERI